ncbi:uncharacterized protein CLUP02_01205 [Colletotrichum lupini]|uniref:Uncharacterized protein n=1 Tax=Colletotrichum lupini TaxID=145971 RepID=A0A9Q8SBX8_9PEZI|nr:uncharacterized protein CLUP02_01205 [Colletotrichum lupini]UQC74554.1 hypothetical protein CLUP02_01205 [Colletotrichum lupini]
MAGNSWTVEAEKALLLSILTTANSGAGIKPDWANVARRMSRLGYRYTVAALSQRFSKSLFKPFNEQMDAAADMPATPAPVPSSRKRAAPGSGTRAARISIAGGSGAAQAANEMASLAISADDGVDDAESDTEDSKKRVKIFHEGLVAALHGQHIDLTGNDTDANMENAAPVSGLIGQPVDLTGDHQVEFKFEGNGTMPSFIHPILVNPAFQILSLCLCFCGSSSFNSTESLFLPVLHPSVVYLYPLRSNLTPLPTSYLPSLPFVFPYFHLPYLTPRISTIKAPIILLLYSHIPTSTNNTTSSLQTPQNFQKMDLTKEFRSLTINDAPAAESRFKLRDNFNGWELEKRVWTACVNGRKYLMAINARKAAEKEEAAAKAAAEATEAAAQAANAMVLD